MLTKLVVIFVTMTTSAAYSCDCTKLKGACVGNAVLVGEDIIRVTAPSGQCAIVGYTANDDPSTATVTDKDKGTTDVDWLGSKKPKVKYLTCDICEK